MSCDSKRRLDKQLRDLYIAACAPLSTESLIHEVATIPSSLLTPSKASYECEYAGGLAAAGFSAINKVFSTLDLSNLDQDDNLSELEASQISAALTMAGTFTQRVSRVAMNITALCTAAAEKLNGDHASYIQDLEQRVKSGDRTSDYSLRQCFNLDLLPALWDSIELPFKNRVDFKKTTAVISDGKIEEKALKVAEFRRRKQRNPTGFQRFHFKEDYEIEPDPPEKNQEPADNRVSTKGSISYALTGEGLSSGSVSSEATEHDDTRLSSEAETFELGSRTSSVGFSFEKERQVIQDEVADPDWDKQQRHQKRFSRIRNRVPTGHPSLMRGASDELAEIVDEFHKWMSVTALNQDAVENTEANRQLVEPNESKNNDTDLVERNV